MVLADVGADDCNGAPLRESSKAKMGLQSRSAEDAEYVGLSSEVPPSTSGSLASPSSRLRRPSSASACLPPPRWVVLKRSKLDVEEDEGTGSTPKLAIARRRLRREAAAACCGRGLARGRAGTAAAARCRIRHQLRRQLAVGGCVARRRLHAEGAESRGGGRGRPPPLAAASDTDSVDRSPSVSLRTNLLDVHLYAISNWVFRLMHARPGMHLFQAEVLPLLISRQYRGELVDNISHKVKELIWIISPNRITSSYCFTARRVFVSIILISG
jgi:hypothetical protein